MDKEKFKELFEQCLLDGDITLENHGPDRMAIVFHWGLEYPEDKHTSDTYFFDY